MQIKKRLRKFLILNKTDILVCLFLSLFIPLFFYNIGGYSLEDFDEAWYGEIARNILITRDPFVLSFNGTPYLDHPPVGFILIAKSIFLFGPNEFAVRFPSALLGFLSIILIYFVGKNLFSRKAGLVAALVLVSCVWFVFRARSGNLDTILVFFFLLTFYFAIKLKQSTNYLYPLTISFAFLILTKSAIGASILIPVILYIAVNRIKISAFKFLISLLLSIAIISPWLVANTQKFGSSYLIEQIKGGSRSSTFQRVNYPEILKSQTFIYFHYGVGKWYYLAIAAFLISLFLFPKGKNLVPVIAWAAFLMYAFTHNSKTEIWHLLPLYVPMALLIGFIYAYVVQRVLKLPILTAAAVIPVVIFSTSLILSFKNSVKLADQQKSPLSQTALAARKYNETLYLDSDLWTPAVAAFYSQKQVTVVKSNPQGLNTLKTLQENAPRPFILITEKWKLLADGIEPSDYKVLFEDRGHVLLKLD